MEGVYTTYAIKKRGERGKWRLQQGIGTKFL